MLFLKGNDMEEVPVVKTQKKCRIQLRTWMQKLKDILYPQGQVNYNLKAMKCDLKKVMKEKIHKLEM